METSAIISWNQTHLSVLEGFMYPNDNEFHIQHFEMS